MSPRVELGAALRLQVAAAVVLGVRLLALPRGDLERELRTSAEANPALIARERRCCARCGRRIIGGSCARCRGSSVGIDPEHVAVDVSPFEELRRDLVAALPAGLAGAAHGVLAAIDERGLLDPCAVAGLAPDDLRRVMAALRVVGPPGVGASSVQESLLLQLDTAPLGAADRAVARRVLTDHADLLAAQGPAAVARIMGRPAAEISALLGRLARLLRPFPALTVPVASVRVAAQPDLFFERDGDRVVAVVAERERWDVAVDAEQQRVLGSAAPGSGRDAAAEQVREAHAIAEQVHRRWGLMTLVGDLLAQEHGAALLAGSTAFTPLTQDAAARRLGVHPSSVSRVVRHRTARLVDGRVVSLQCMFGAHHDARAAVARLAAHRPRPSDREIAEALAAQGFRIARRTVAKYRLAVAPHA